MLGKNKSRQRIGGLLVDHGCCVQQVNYAISYVTILRGSERTTSSYDMLERTVCSLFKARISLQQLLVPLLIEEKPSIKSVTSGSMDSLTSLQRENPIAR